MKKSVKKILGILCSLVMLASCVVDAAAKGVVAEPSKTVEEQISEIQNDDSLSAEMKEIMIAKLTYTGEDITPLSLIEGEVTNELSNFPYYYQEGEYWCVPACAQMVIKYTTGTVSYTHLDVYKRQQHQCAGAGQGRVRHACARRGDQREDDLPD